MIVKINSKIFIKVVLLVLKGVILSYNVNFNDINELVCLEGLGDDFSEGHFENVNFKGSINQKYLGEGLTVIKFEMIAKEDIKIFKHEPMEFNSFYFTHYLSGKALLQSEANQINKTLSQNQIHMGYANIMQGSETVKANERYKIITLAVNKDFMPKIDSQNPTDFFPTSKARQLDSLAYNFSRFIYDLDLHEPLNLLLAKGKTYEYLHHQLKYLTNGNTQTKVKLDNHDIKALHKAKQILNQNISNPPSIKELSRLVGMNDFKLKYGFKMLFNQTPYGYLFEAKMQKAKTMLNSKDYNVSEVAKLIGYSQHGNFTKAFCGYFGFYPKDLKKYT